MPCPSEELLTVCASLRAQGAPAEDGEEVLPGWTGASLRAHLAACASCAEQVEQLTRSLTAWRGADLIDDPGRFDDDYFIDLTDSVMRRIEAHSTPAQVVALRPRRLRGSLAAAAAIAAVLVVAVWSRGPDVVPSEELVAVAADDLDAVGRELGRDLLDSALSEDEELEEERIDWTASLLLDESDDDTWTFSTTLADEIDELTDVELRSVIARL